MGEEVKNKLDLSKKSMICPACNKEFEYYEKARIARCKHCNAMFSKRRNVA